MIHGNNSRDIERLERVIERKNVGGRTMFARSYL